MVVYKNLNSDSGVSHYLIESEFIKVKFKDGKSYLYSNSKPGKFHVDKLKELALAGRGLNSYINKHVRKSYHSKSTF